MTSLYLSKGSGGRFDFDDGGTYSGGWEDGKAHGHGLCTGPKDQGEYTGAWHYGFEVSGVYVYPNGITYEGQWLNGRQHGLGAETRGRWVYRGEWTNGLRGRYGVRQCITSGAKYDGTWANGLQDGYGSELYADGGTFQGQWMKGMRHGFGVRSSAPFGLAMHYKPRNYRSSSTSLRDNAEVGTDRERRVGESRGGFVLTAGGSETFPRRRSLVDKTTGTLKGNFFKGLKVKKQMSTGDIDGKATAWSIRSTGSNFSSTSSESNHSGHTHESGRTDSSFVSQDEVTDANVIETYMGEWKNDKRSGCGIAERSDGLKYEGEWYNNKKYGYGVTTLKDGTQEMGKYVNNVLVTSGTKKHLFLLRSAKYKAKVAVAVDSAHGASQVALEKADIAISRMATARGKAEQADIASAHSREDSCIARLIAKQFAPEFRQPGAEFLRRKLASSRESVNFRGGLQVREDTPHLRSRSLYASSGIKDSLSVSKENILYSPTNGDVNVVCLPAEVSNPPSQSALLDVFRNNPDRRPSTAGFLRRPSAIGNLRRPSTVVELKLTPGHIQQYSDSFQSNPYKSVPEYNTQQVLDDHFSHYYEKVNKVLKVKKPVRFSENFYVKTQTPGFLPLSHFYGISSDATPDSGVSESMDNEETSPTRPPRRSTLPTVLYPENVRLNFDPTDIDEGEVDRLNLHMLGVVGEGVVRTGSLNHVPASRRPQGPKKINSGVSARKKSLPDISDMGQEGHILNRETIAALSSQRREAIRKQEEEAERLRANPLLYLISPDMRDWLSQQQLLILVLFINISLAIMFFKLLT